MSARRRLTDPSMIVALIALVVALGGSAVAATVVITKSSQVKDGALSERDLSAKARKRLAGRGGAAGPTGAPGVPGARGETGPKGDAGTPADTSAFYTKADSDGRFLGLTATAADAAKLDGTPAASFSTTAVADDRYVRTGGAAASLRSTAVGIPNNGNTFTLLNIAALGQIRSVCPALATTATVWFHNTSAGGVAVFAEDADADDVIREFIAASADSTVQTVDAADHLTFLLGSGTILDQAEVSVWGFATGGGSGCQFRIHYSVTKLG